MVESLVPWHVTSIFMGATLGVLVTEYWHWQFLSLINIVVAIILAITGIGDYGKNLGDMLHFVRDKRLKLYEGRYLYDFIQDPKHAHPINLKTAGKKAKASYKMLSSALENLKSQIPEGDEYTGRSTRVLSTKPGMRHLQR